MESNTPVELSVAIRTLLKHYRESRELSMNRLAEKTGLSQQTISYVERGMRDPTLQTILRICSALELPPSQLFAEAEKLLLRTQ